MTLPFQPHRTSSEDDEIDQQLNHWVAGVDTEPGSDNATDALEFHRWANETRRTDPAATGPAAGTFDRVLRNSAQKSSKGIGEMSTAALGPKSSGFSVISRESASQSIRHYTNLAATVTLVLVIAVGGWLAMTQVNQPGGGPEPRLAALGLQRDEPGNGVCDVEPLTVDETINIMKDPVGSLIPEIENPAAAGYPGQWFGPRAITVPNVYWYMSEVSAIEEHGVNFPEADFKDAQPVVNEFLDCLIDGTRGQTWRLMDPITVHALAAQYILVLSSEEDAREKLPQILEEPAVLNHGVLSEGRLLRLNPDQTLTGYMAASSRTGFPGYAFSPVVYLDPEGNTLIGADLFGNTLDDPHPAAEGSMNVIYGRSAVDNQWYVIDFFYPFSVPSWE